MFSRMPRKESKYTVVMLTGEVLQKSSQISEDEIKEDLKVHFPVNCFYNTSVFGVIIEYCSCFIVLEFLCLYCIVHVAIYGLRSNDCQV